MSKKIYAKIEFEGYGSYIVPIDSVKYIENEVQASADQRDLEAQWWITLVELTEEEFAELPEFTGW